TFADEELGRRPASGARGVQADELAHRIKVLPEAVELLGLLPGRRATEAGADGVDENEIADVEQRCVVVDHPVRGCRRRGALRDVDATGADQAEVEPGR